MSEPSSGGIERDEVLAIIDEVEAEVLSEDLTGATREMVAEGTCQRIRDRVRSVDPGTDHDPHPDAGGGR